MHTLRGFLRIHERVWNVLAHSDATPWIYGLTSGSLTWFALYLAHLN